MSVYLVEFAFRDNKLLIFEKNATFWKDRRKYYVLWELLEDQKFPLFFIELAALYRENWAFVEKLESFLFNFRNTLTIIRVLVFTSLWVNFGIIAAVSGIVVFSDQF